MLRTTLDSVSRDHGIGLDARSGGIAEGRLLAAIETTIAQQATGRLPLAHAMGKRTAIVAYVADALSRYATERQSQGRPRRLMPLLKASSLVETGAARPSRQSRARWSSDVNSTIA
jgi:hypothetical protein